MWIIRGNKEKIVTQDEHDNDEDKEYAREAVPSLVTVKLFI